MYSDVVSHELVRSLEAKSPSAPSRECTGRSLTLEDIDEALKAISGKQHTDNKTSLLSLSALRWNNLHQPGKTLTEQLAFKLFIGAVVVFNAIQLGVEMDHPDHLYVYVTLDWFFTSIFAIEMVLKLQFHRLEYFHDRWNWLDFGLAWMSILDTWILPFAMEGQQSDLRTYSVLRILRILRLIRAIRLLRMFRELWKIVKGITDSLKTILWAFLLLVLVLYVCGIFCVAIIGKNTTVGYYRSIDEADDPDFHTDFDAYQYYGTVLRSMFTLFETCIEPLNIRPVVERQPVMLLFFCMFIFLTTFGVLNVIIGVIVDHAMAVSPEVRRQEAIESLRCEMMQLNAVSEACSGADDDHDGIITIKEIERAMQGEGMKKTLENMELPLGITAKELFSLLDTTGDEGVSTKHMNDQLMRAVVQSDHQQILELKICLHETNALARKSFSDMHRVIANLSANTVELKNELSVNLRNLGSVVESLQSSQFDSDGEPNNIGNSTASTDLQSIHHPAFAQKEETNGQNPMYPAIEVQNSELPVKEVINDSVDFVAPLETDAIMWS